MDKLTIQHHREDDDNSSEKSSGTNVEQKSEEKKIDAVKKLTKWLITHPMNNEDSKRA